MKNWLPFVAEKESTNNIVHGTYLLKMLTATQKKLSGQKKKKKKKPFRLVDKIGVFPVTGKTKGTQIISKSLKICVAIESRSSVQKKKPKSPIQTTYTL